MRASSRNIRGTPAWSAARRAATIFVTAATISGGCSGGSIVNLGEQSPRPYHFGVPRALTELGADASDNPTLTGDLLEIFFTSNRDGVSTDVWTAHRVSTDQPFADVTAVAAVNTAYFETSSAISRDGLTLWFGSDRPGGLGDLDIWMVQRSARDAAWAQPVDLPLLSSPSLDLPRPPGLHDLVMPLSSQRGNPNVYWTYFSARPTVDGPFGAPTVLPELAFADESTVDGFLTDDGLTLFYSSSAPMGLGDLYVAWRRSTSDPFSLSEPLDELNTAHAERDPWLSPDGQTFFFTSDRDGVSQIYQVATTRP